jgi:hypothetical protein
MSMTTPAVPEPSRHHAVINPRHLRHHREGKTGMTARVNDFLATRLAVLFGLAWTIWVFFIVPLVAYFLPATTQGHIFFFSSGWIQLFALPLMIYVGNKLQRSADAQSDSMTKALSHIAIVEDQNAELLKQNTELTRAVHAMLSVSKGS